MYCKVKAARHRTGRSRL